MDCSAVLARFSLNVATDTYVCTKRIHISCGGIMKQPLVHIKWFIWLLLILLFSILSIVPAQASLSLTKMTKEESPYQTKLIFGLSSMPKFELKHSGQRVDLLLSDAGIATNLHNLPEDQTIIKVLLAKKHDDLMISLLLRRLPEQVVAESKNNPPRIEMDLYWSGDDKSTRPGVAFRIDDMPPRKAGKKASNFQKSSPWDDDWMSFFREYRSLWQLEMPLHYTLPTLPRLISDEDSPLWPLQQHADKEMFLSLLQAAENLSDLTAEQIYVRDQFVAEAQLRTGALEAGTVRLNNLYAQNGSQQVRVEYLTAYAQALNGQPLVAQLTLAAALPNLAEDEPLLPFYRLLYVETALASQQDKVALEQLESVTNWPEALLDVVALRRADAKAGLGELTDAQALYRDLIEKTDLFERYPFSYNRAAFSAFKLKDYAFSYQLYRPLAELSLDQSGSDLLLFAAGAAALESGDVAWGMIGLERTVLERPGTEGGDRAELRLLDHKINTGGKGELSQAAYDYGLLAQRSQSRAVREEGYFKQALAHYLSGEKQLSVNELITFRRDFLSSALCREVDLLLTRQLPDVVHQLIEEQNDLAAVVLVEKNRTLLLNDQLSRDFLNDVAKAFERLGLYQRATRVLLYLFDKTKGQADHEGIYLPLARSYKKQGEEAIAADYAELYLRQYPHGDDAAALYGLLLDAFDHQGKNEEILQWLHNVERPSSMALELRAAQVYWQQRDYAAVVESLNKAQELGKELDVKEMALLAEASYQSGALSNADNYFRSLFDDPELSSQARYRSAQISLKRGDRERSLQILEDLVATDSDSGWGKLAQDLLITEKQ
jgi:outer membrane protein assembly factor BamD (BamD/ComL family)